MPIKESDAPSGIDDAFCRAVVENSPDAIVAIDRNYLIMFTNPAAERLFGFAAENVLGEDLNLLLPERFHDSHTVHIGAFAVSKVESRYMAERQSHIVGRHASGREINIGASIMQMTVRGEPVYVAFLRDVGWRIELMSKLSHQARRDPLTGLLNRRSFYDIAEYESARAHRYGTRLACLFFDLDHFKSVNDEFGHDAGDSVLKGFAELTKQELRSVDSLCRWGGEEFVALLPNVDRKGAVAAAERVRKALDDMVFTFSDGRRAHLTVSVGVALGAGTDVDFTEQARRADAALYAAKDAGRNRVIVWKARGTGSPPAEGMP